MRTVSVRWLNVLILVAMAASCLALMRESESGKMTADEVLGQMCSQQGGVADLPQGPTGSAGMVVSGARRHRHAGPSGHPGVAGEASRVIHVRARDNWRFVPAEISVRRGETIRFVVTNAGKVRHEMILGSEHALESHYREMMKFRPMAHDEPYMVTVEPGRTGEIVWRFSEAGVVNFACLQPGHYAAGMKGSVRVSPAR